MSFGTRNFGVAQCILFILYQVSAWDIFESVGRLGPCFDVKKNTECSSTIRENFQSEYKPAGLNDPDTWLYLFTPQSPDAAEALHKCGGFLPSSSTYDPNAITIVLVHGGFDGMCRTAWMREMKEQFMQRGDYNVILVDWTWGNPPNFVVSAANWKVTGDQVGFVLRNIMNQTGTGPDKFHIIGHSFGAQVSTFIARAVDGLGRITALDPAVTPDAFKPDYVSTQDADLVDVIHSNGGNCVGIYFGDIQRLGHADFYPNGGVFQPACYLDSLKAFIKGDFSYALGILYPPLCSHLQSLQYFKASINPDNCQFIGIAANSYEEFKRQKPNFEDNDWAIMGMDFDKYPRTDEQKYYLDTKLKCPYVDTRYYGDKSLPFNQACRKSLL